MSGTKSRDGEFIGSGMRATFLKDKIDLAHARGYAVLVIRVTSPDAPDSKAVYDMYQVDANKGLAVQDMYEALKAVEHDIQLPELYLPSLQVPIHKVLAKAEGGERHDWLPWDGRARA